MEDFLARFALFQDLDHEAIARLAGSVTETEYPRGAVVFSRGDPCPGFHIVVYGQIKLALQTDSGEEKVVELVAARGSFGEAAMFLGKPHLLTAETLEASKLVHIPKHAVMTQIHRNPMFAQRFISELSARLYRQFRDLENCVLRSGTERVVSFLLDALNGHAAGESAQIVLPARKGIIASRLNLTQEYFSRILHELIAEGLIEVEGRNVNIPDRERLRARAAGARMHPHGRGPG